MSVHYDQETDVLYVTFDDDDSEPTWTDMQDDGVGAHIGCFTKKVKGCIVLGLADKVAG